MAGGDLGVAKVDPALSMVVTTVCLGMSVICPASASPLRAISAKPSDSEPISARTGLIRTRKRPASHSQRVTRMPPGSVSEANQPGEPNGSRCWQVSGHAGRQ